MENSKNIFILGDSYSTYQSYIPEGYSYYYSDDRTELPIIGTVENTWWKKLTRDGKYEVVCNDSYSGATVCNSVRPHHTKDVSFINRLDKYIEQGFFSDREIDTFIVFGGTNDSWTDVPVGSLIFDNWTDKDKDCALPAFCYLLNRLKDIKSIKNVLAVINCDLSEAITVGYAAACKEYDIPYLLLKNIEKENGHPNTVGMEQICNQIADKLAEFD